MNRFCLGCATRRLQMDDAPCEMCGRVNLVTAPRPRKKMHPLARLVRFLLRPLGWFTQVLTVGACVFTVWAMALRWILPFLGFITLGFLGLWLFAGFVWTVRLVTRGAVWLFQPATRTVGRSGIRSFALLPLCVIALAVLNHFDVPFRVAYRMSKADLESIALSARRSRPGTTLFTVPRAGWYRVKRLDVGRGKSVRIQVTENVFLGGVKAGFARCPQGCAAVPFPPLFVQDIGAPVYTPLSDGWVWWEQKGDDF